MPEGKKSNRKKIFITIIIIVALAGAAVFYFFDFRNREQKRNENMAMLFPANEQKDETRRQEEVTASDKTVSDKEADKTLQKNAPVAMPPYTGESIRLLNGDAKFIASVGAAFLGKYEKNLQEVADRLDKDPKNYDDWLAVAYIKKLFSNYIGTRDAWEYAKVVSPDSPGAYFNLGELYGYELKDPTKAEENYKSSLRLDPYHLGYYVGLASFYKDVMENPQKAEGVLLSALEKIPHTEPNLFTEIGAFYRDQKNFTRAIEYFEKAFESTGDPAIQKNIKNEITRIRSKMEAQ